MTFKNDFWLQLHRLTGCLEAEGETRRDRLGRIISSWEIMPRSAREQVATELAHLLAELPELGAMVDERLAK